MMLGTSAGEMLRASLRRFLYPLGKGRKGGRRTTQGSGLPAWRGRFPLGVSFERAKETKTRLGRSPLRTSLWVRGRACVKSKFGPLPLLWLLLLPPHQATLGSWPYGWTVSMSGHTLEKRRSRRRKPGPRQLGTVACQGKALTVEGLFFREVDTFCRISTPSM